MDWPGIPGLSSESLVTNDISHGMAHRDVALFVTMLLMLLMDNLIRYCTHIGCKLNKCGMVLGKGRLLLLLLLFFLGSHTHTHTHTQGIGGET